MFTLSDARLGFPLFSLFSKDQPREISQFYAGSAKSAFAIRVRLKLNTDFESPDRSAIPSIDTPRRTRSANSEKRMISDETILIYFSFLGYIKERCSVVSTIVITRCACDRKRIRQNQFSVAIVRLNRCRHSEKNNAGRIKQQCYLTSDL